jgi:hypothetical protein
MFTLTNKKFEKCLFARNLAVNFPNVDLGNSKIVLEKPENGPGICPRKNGGNPTLSYYNV